MDLINAHLRKYPPAVRRLPINQDLLLLYLLLPCHIAAARFIFILGVQQMRYIITPLTNILIEYRIVGPLKILLLLPKIVIVAALQSRVLIFNRCSHYRRVLGILARARPWRLRPLSRPRSGRKRRRRVPIELRLLLLVLLQQTPSTRQNVRTIRYR